MFRIYWTETHQQQAHPHFRDFNNDEMNAALHYIETLRQRQRAGEALQHITLSSENPQSVGLLGVASPSADYQWKNDVDKPLTPLTFACANHLQERRRQNFR